MGEAYEEGRYAEGLPLAQQAYDLARSVRPEGPEDLTSLNYLAALYVAQGLVGEAAPLYEQSVPPHREVLGKRHPNTLAILDNLAVFL